MSHAIIRYRSSCARVPGLSLRFVVRTTGRRLSSVPCCDTAKISEGCGTLSRLANAFARWTSDIEGRRALKRLDGCAIEPLFSSANCRTDEDDQAS